MTVSPLTEDILVALLKKTSLPTILVEGKDDFTIYRWVEGRLGSYNVNILPCNGRKTLLDVYKRRSEFTNSKVAFIADRDMWLFTSIPSEYQDIIWTDGYSIENDLYEPSSLDLFLNHQEMVKMRLVLDKIIKWYSFEVEEYRIGRNAVVAIHPNRIVEYETFSLRAGYMAERGYYEPNVLTINEIHNDYKLKIRGKTLFEIFARFTNYKNRIPKYSIDALIDIALRATPINHRLDRIMSAAIQRLID